MKHKDISGDGSTLLLVFDEGDEIKATLADFIEREGIRQASFSAVGALSSVELIAFDVDTKQYRTAFAADEQVELANLTGNAAYDESGQPAVHAHAVIGRRDGAAFAGHLKHGIVRPTCELVLRVEPIAAEKTRDERWGLSLYFTSSASRSH